MAFNRSLKLSVRFSASGGGSSLAKAYAERSKADRAKKIMASQ
jgi:hypothetical protein